MPIDTSLPACLDALAVRLKTITGMLQCYTVTGSLADDGTLQPIPPSIDSTPVSNLWFRGEDVAAGNSEMSVALIELGIWERGTSGGYGYTVLMNYPDRVKTLLRTDGTLGGRATLVEFLGADEIRPQFLNSGQPYLYLPCRIRLKRLYMSSDYRDT